MGKQTTFATIGGTKSLGYLATPPGGKGPGVVVIQEWWGLVHHIQQVCDRLAAEGFVALAPDLYHGDKTKSPDDAGRLMMALDIDRAARDLHGAIKHLLASGAAGKSVGVIGFCMGGQLALYAASKFPEVGLCADFYGIHPKVKPDYKSIKCPVLGFFGEKDAYVGPPVAKKLEDELKAAGVKTDFTIFPADHAFFNDSRPEVYDPAAAKQAWNKTLVSLRANLS
jgi:carboxymethylenebutenolidase